MKFSIEVNIEVNCDAQFNIELLKFSIEVDCDTLTLNYWSLSLKLILKLASKLTIKLPKITIT